jgi:hypothetical protein
MTQGIVYFNSGERCLVRLCVSINSLRRVYRGPIAVLAQKDLLDWVRHFLRGLEADIHCFDDDSAAAPRTMKASLWRHSPFDISLFLDSDTLVLRDPVELFDQILHNDFLVTRFSAWTTDTGLMVKRIKEWSRVLGDSDLQKALQFGPAINTGVVGWKKEAAILPAWEQLARAGWYRGCTRRLVDELACQVLLPRFRHVVVGEEWNSSVRFGISKDPAIIHYHGNRHITPGDHRQRWLQEYWALRNSGHPIGPNIADAHGDAALQDHLRGARQNDISIVTVVNPAYRERLKQNWERWLKTVGLKEQRFIVFAVGDPDVDFLMDANNVTIIPWNRMGDNREACLSAFVFAVAEFVDTTYWMKLDCDVCPITPKFDWPAYHGKTITAQKWGFTRVKGDPNATRHWLNILDDWWGESPLFPRNLDPHRRHQHTRFNSFCSIEKTSFTSRLAGRCGNRLPIPSQDTTAWYVATRWNEPVELVDIPRFLQIRPRDRHPCLDGWFRSLRSIEDFHLLNTRHAWHTRKAGRALVPDPTAVRRFTSALRLLPSRAVSSA